MVPFIFTLINTLFLYINIYIYIFIFFFFFFFEAHSVEIKKIIYNIFFIKKIKTLIIIIFMNLLTNMYYDSYKFQYIV